MRWLVFWVIVFAALWYLRGIEEMPPPTADDSFIGNQIKPLRKAEGFEESYLKMNDERKKRMEEQLEKSSGG